MEEKIERIFARAFIIGDKHKKVIAEITKACQSDMAEALQAQGETFREIEDEWVERVRELMAQLAEMREALEMADKFARSIEFVNPELVETWPIREAIKQALSAAPEVLWAGEGTIKHKYSLEDDPAIITAQLVFDELPPGWLLNAKDGQQVKVIVVKEMKDESTISKTIG